MEKKEFHGKLVTIIYWLKELKAFGLDGKDFSTREHKIIIIINEIMEIYLILQSDYYLKSDSLLQDYLNESAALLCGTIIFDIHRYISSIETIVSLILEPGEWEKVCWRRSAIEALKELYQHTVFEQYFYEIEIDEDTEERLEFLSQREGPVSEDEIPKGIPSSHWWWWGEPPE